MNDPEIFRIERLESSLSEDRKEGVDWLNSRIRALTQQPDGKHFYITISQLSRYFPAKPVFPEHTANQEFPQTEEYLFRHGINQLEYARMLLIAMLLRVHPEFYRDKVRKLIEVADRFELETFLRYLVTLPAPEDYSFAAVEALRTNIAPVFDAISQRNPYPMRYFNEQQWNQMYLKAAFMGRNLNGIEGVEQRANEALARIISDYAHERWAAGRQIDPVIWRPVSRFLHDSLFEDVHRLWRSELPAEREAAALVCWASGQDEAMELLETDDILNSAVRQGELSWEQLGQQQTFK